MLFYKMISKKNSKKGGNMFVDIGTPALLLGSLKFMKSRNKKYAKKNKTKKIKKNRNRNRNRNKK